MLAFQTVMVKFLVFAERAVNGLPSANPCLQNLASSDAHQSLFFDDHVDQCGAVSFFVRLQNDDICS